MAAVGSVVAAFLVWLVPQENPQPLDAMLAKGVADAWVVEVGCRHGKRVVPDRCERGDSLLIRVDGVTRPVYLAAWIIGPGGQRVWYFPDENGEMPRIGPTSEPELISRSVLIGPEHVPGKSRIRVMLFESALTREQVEATAPLAFYHFELLVESQ